jgi:hypothetical protein
VRTRFLCVSSLSLSLVIAGGACGGDDDDDDDDDDDGGGITVDGGGGQQADAAGPIADAGPDADGYQPILTTRWTLPPPDSPTPDRYFCADMTVPEDMIIAGFRTISPNGTHHTVLSVGEPRGPDSPHYECGVGSNRTVLMYASGVGTDDFVFPEGVGLRVEAGQQVRLNVHTFNATDFDLTGTSGVAVRLVPAVETETEFTLAGPVGFSIEGDNQPHEVTGSCRIPQDATVLNWWPHMHKLGRHMKIEVGGEVVHDDEFSFTEQINYPTTRQISAGESIDVTCTFVNDTGETVGWGDSSNQEMCFAGFYRYPKADQDFCGGF